MKKCLLSLVLALSFFLNSSTLAQSETVTNKPFVAAVEDIFTGDGAILNGNSGLPDYTGASEYARTGEGVNDAAQTGAFQLRNILTTVIGFIEKMMVPVAIILLLWGALSLLIERGNEEKFKMRISQILWTGLGFVLFVVMFNLVDFVFFGIQGDIFQDGNFAKMGQAGANELYGLINFAASFAVAIAVAFIVFGAIKLILVGEAEEEQANIRKQIIFAALGILLIAAAGTIAKIFFGTGTGENIEINSALLIGQMVFWINLILGFIGLGAVFSIIWAGVQMILNFGNEEMVSKSKKIIMFAVIGLILAFSAFTITRFFITPGIYSSNQTSESSQLQPFDRAVTTP